MACALGVFVSTGKSALSTLVSTSGRSSNSTYTGKAALLVVGGGMESGWPAPMALSCSRRQGGLRSFGLDCSSVLLSSVACMSTGSSNVCAAAIWLHQINNAGRTHFSPAAGKDFAPLCPVCSEKGSNCLRQTRQHQHLHITQHIAMPNDNRSVPRKSEEVTSCLLCPSASGCQSRPTIGTL